ncbi:RNA-binding protein YlmH [Melghiribacillus thermohalophilus]|uniref:RNA-binding protein YlmH n=2 Tax=Melghiribacillus thermohalophilus TaxID=1324956 RepID=A0A4R3NHT8_9BACI|nr:RNA-binding protein [Melghiribacillus thermohalophilus]TCT26852.1 RNA-binding protein YlmH [Melghiribacillus thermohalophilus]
MDIYQHFREEEKSFIDQVLSWKEEVEQSYIPKLTDFLDPREQHIFQSIVGQHSDFKLHFFGGGEQTERKRGILAPYYENLTEDDFHIGLLEASYPNKFVQITHRDVLGSLMSLGIKRKKLGDIIIHNDRIQILCDQEISTFLRFHLTGIRKAKVEFCEKELRDFRPSQEEWIIISGTVSSLRLDAVISEIYQVSRQKAIDWIKKGAVKVNFRIVENPAFQVEEGDLFSIRKKGRSKFQAIHGKTKKGKWKMTAAKLK